MATNSSHTGSHRTRNQPVIDGGASTAPDHVETLPNDVSKLSAAADGSQLAISIGHKTRFRTCQSFRGARGLPLVLATKPRFRACQSFRGARGLGDVRSLEHSASIGAESACNTRSLGHNAAIETEATDRLASDQSASAFLEYVSLPHRRQEC